MAKDLEQAVTRRYGPCVTRRFTAHRDLTIPPHCRDAEAGAGHGASVEVFSQIKANRGCPLDTHRRPRHPQASARRRSSVYG